MSQAILQKTLKNLGLSESEMIVFTFLFEQGASFKATEIARKVGVNRTTLYGMLKSLIERGLVSSTEKESGVIHFQSIQPHLLIDVLEREKEKLAKNAEEIKIILPALISAQKSKQSYYPKVQFFEGVEGIRQVYEDTIANNPQREAFGFVKYDAAIDFLGEEWAHYYIQKRKKYAVFANTIAAHTGTGEEYASKDKVHFRKTKFFPKEYQFDMEIISYGDRTAFMSFDKERPIGIVIEDRKIAEMVKTLFRYINNTL